MLNIPADQYLPNRIKDLARRLRAAAEELDSFDRRLFDQTAPPDDFTMESLDVQVRLVSESLTSIAGDVPAWWNLTAHQFAEVNP